MPFPSIKRPQEAHFTKLWKVWVEKKEAPLEVVKAVLYHHRSRSMLSIWDVFEPKPYFSLFFYDLLLLSQVKSTDYPTRTLILDFFILCFQSLEIPIVRQECFRLISISIWSNLSPETRLEMELAKSPHLLKLWKHSLKKFKKATSEEQTRLQVEKKWLSELLIELHSLISQPKLPQDQNQFVCRCLHWLVVLESQLPLRRFVHVLLQDHLIERCFQFASKVIENQTLQNALDLLCIFYKFPVNALTGQVVKEEDQALIMETLLQQFQQWIYPHVTPLALASYYQLQKSTFLIDHLQDLSDSLLVELLHTLGVRTQVLGSSSTMSRQELVNQVCTTLIPLTSPLQAWSTFPLYPVTQQDETAQLITQPSTPRSEKSSSTCFLDQLMPPLSLQYVSFSDYLFRHFCLYRHESGYAIRSDIDFTVTKLRPYLHSTSHQTHFRGYSPMALVPHVCHVSRIGPLAVLDNAPSHVLMAIRFDTSSCPSDFLKEWEALSKGEVVFLVSVIALANGRPWKIVAVRGATVDSMVGYDDLPLHYDRSQRSEVQDDPSKLHLRTLKVYLDRHQYHWDRTHLTPDALDTLYGSFNVVVRRHRRENNFWAVLQSIRNLFSQPDLLPSWLREVYLGYGDPSSVHFKALQPSSVPLYFHSTFCSREHLIQSFPDQTVEFETPGIESDGLLLHFNENDTIMVTRPSRLPLHLFQPTPMDFSTPIYFTPSQIHAIRSGISHGLTLIVGPPGTGKTDVAVHLLCNLYHGQPNERILLLTHSNQALNQLFEKLLVLNNIPERHLLRLGHSDEEWTGYDQYGRVTHFMERRADLLQKVDVLAKSLNIVGDHAYTCETATAFFKSIIQPLWSTFKKEPFASDNESWKAFPFHSFFRTLYPNNSLLQADIPPNEQIDSIFDACWHYLVSLFDDISQSRAFEVLKSDWDKANLLLARDAKIVAMTTTYASLKRNDLIDLGFEFDSFVMEEAGTVLEIETFVPLSLSRRLKRVVMIGDHRQLPPVVQCPSLQAMADSLFVRLIRLGVTTISLDQQGRTRKSICELYHHVYPGLGHLPVVETMVDANPGFLLEYQFINVLNYRGQGEIQPEPHYYQNLGEAEYMVAVYQYMCLLGYPKDQVVMLTTYNGQKILLKEVLRKRCSWNLTLFPPCLITTVDKFQGQQANYVLLSLVRTEKVGHVADLRRLVVAMSRARLGLYIFGRQTLFEVWPDLAPTFHHLLSRPTQLQLLPNECFPCQRKLVEHQESANAMTIRDVDAMCRLVMHITKQRKLDMNENSNNIDKNEKLGEERVE